jgi:hypothetical protein
MIPIAPSKSGATTIFSISVPRARVDVMDFSIQQMVA